MATERQVETRREVIAFRQRIILMEAGGAMSVEEFCAEHRRRGWAFDDLSPARLGLPPDAILRLRGNSIVRLKGNV